MCFNFILELRFYCYQWLFFFKKKKNCFLDPLVFQEYDFTNDISVFDGAQSDNVTTGDTTPPPPTQSSRLGIRPISLPFRRKKPRKQAKDSVSGSKDLGKESDSV